MTHSIGILMRSPKFLLGAITTVLMILLVVIYPLINRGDPLEMMALAFQPPGNGLLLGSDNFGRDLFLELVYGIRTSIIVGLVAGVVATAIGLVIGLASGYIGGLVDNILTAVTNMFIVILSFIILILISVSLNSRSSLIVAMIIGLTSWPWTARAVRAQTTSLRNRDPSISRKFPVIARPGSFYLKFCRISPPMSSWPLFYRWHPAFWRKLRSPC
ncbi:ABC-type dipeptide/oligopeptide/nickel transport system permease subunit [Paenibacillus phyllosphaerae]|uniref:ABC-type dipeptide/oligopeptide/nickel transport system permease subunit n=1 Tax=Paenibacillus phyllosphaerae TaxID=274593 RepID=A0A7W5B5A8_9BACL|nr:hypothetical protein [Paenibacillus phyllosphaerae]MBB3114693.1 ABC-type dipeptide/oligopeptide/nickel transport system permease subunit [Paenibacillus phyllosphaerae]